nr:phosphatase PAP2 family protein [Cellulosimicrobium arenosum]
MPSPKTSARAVGTVLLGWAAQAGAKAAWRRPRPDVVALVPTPGSSTPSGHVTNLTVVAVVVHGLVAGSALSPTARRTVAAVLALVVVLTALDRVAVGAHRPSDVVLGTVLGVAVGAACARLRA